jgi:hypothetical protein
MAAEQVAESAALASILQNFRETSPPFGGVLAFFAWCVACANEKSQSPNTSI